MSEPITQPSAGAVIIPAVLYLPSLPFGEGAFGQGDVKLLAGIGLMLAPAPARAAPCAR